MSGEAKHNKQHHHANESEDFHLGLLIVIVGLAFFISWLGSPIDRKELMDMYKLRVSLMQVLPEGQKFYDEGYTMAYRAYEVSLTEKKITVPDLFKKNGGEEAQAALNAKIQSFLAKYIFAFGVLYAVVFKSLWFIALSFLVALGLFIYNNRRAIEELFVYLKAKYLYNPFPNDNDINRVLAILLANPVPASILHHNPHKFGLFEHSYSVAKKVVNELAKKNASEQKQRDGFLAGLLHDIGKIRLYRYECKEPFYVPSPLDDESEKTKKRKKICKWTSVGINQEVVNKTTMLYLAKKYGIRIPKDADIWKIVKKKDGEATTEELKNADYPLDRYFEKALRSLNINDIFETGKSDGWHREDFPYVAVLAYSLNKSLVKAMKEEDPAIPLSEEPDHRGVHTIAHIIPRKLSKYLEPNPKSRFWVWNIKVKGTTFKGVYLLKKEFIPQDLLERWKDTEHEIKKANKN